MFSPMQQMVSLGGPAANQRVCHSGPILSQNTQIQGIEISPLASIGSIPAVNQHACHSGPRLSQIQGIEMSLGIHIYTAIYTAGLSLT